MEKQLRKRADYTQLLCVDGKQFKNVAAFCEEYNLGYRTVLAHLKKGHSGAEIVRIMLELPGIRKKNRGSRPISYAGIEYPSIAEACRQMQIDRGRVYNFLRQGISPRKPWNEQSRQRKHIWAKRMAGAAAVALPETLVQ